MDAYMIEMSILDDEYKLSMLINESNYFYSIIQDNTIINESFGSKIKEIISKFIGKIKEIWDNIKRWFKNVKTKILIKLSEECISSLDKLGWDVTKKPGKDTNYTNRDAKNESVIYEDNSSIKKEKREENQNKKYYYYDSDDIKKFVIDEIKKSYKIFESYDEIYKLLNEYNNLAKESMKYTDVVEKYDYDMQKIIESPENKKFMKLADDIEDTQKKIEEKLTKDSENIDIGKFDKSNELSASRNNKKSIQIKQSTVSGNKMFYKEPTYDVKAETTIKEISSIYKKYFNDMSKKLDMIEKYVDSWIKQLIAGIKDLEKKALTLESMDDKYKGEGGYIYSAEMVNKTLPVYNKSLKQFQELQKCINSASKLLISHVMFIHANVFSAIKHNIMFKKANKNLYDYKERQLRGEVDLPNGFREPSWIKMV